MLVLASLPYQGKIPLKFSREAFQPHEGKEFFIDLGTEKISAELIDVSDMLETSDGVKESRQFSLVWRGPAEAVIEQGTYKVSHPELGEADLFLVPIGPDKEGMRYEAVFT